MAYIDLTELMVKRCLNIKRCPRCGGTIFWWYRWCSPEDKQHAKNEIKCFSCARHFVLVPTGHKENGNAIYIWREFPDRNESYALVEERIPTTPGEKENEEVSIENKQAKKDQKNISQKNIFQKDIFQKDISQKVSNSSQKPCCCRKAAKISEV